MSNDAERLVQRAVRRDLGRARLLLSTSAFVPRDRRRALVRHLDWLAGLLRAEEPELRPPLAELAEAALRFRDRGDPAERRRLLSAVVRLGGVLARTGDWVGPAAVARAGRDVHWLVDGLDAGSREHLTRLLAAYGVRRQRVGA